MKTLPYSWYHDPAVFERELAMLGSQWHYAGHFDSPSGSYFPTEVSGAPVLVVAGKDSEIRAFYNVCRHRGSIICEAAITRDVIQCPYHAWVYELDGSLRAAPRSDREADFDRSELGLIEVSAGRWGPFIFVNLDPHASNLEEHLGRLPQLVAAAGVDVSNLRLHKRVQADFEVNWKICAENFLECYHCPTAHPGFSRVIDVGPDDYRLEVDPWFSTQYGPVREKWSGPFDPRGEVERGQFHFVWPTTTINIMPGRPNISIGPIIPRGAQRTTRYLDYLFTPDAEEEWISEALAFDWQVGLEDAELVARVQRGVASGILREGVLMPESEQLIAHFDSLLRAAVGVATGE